MAAVNAAIKRLEQDPLSSASDDVLARVAPTILRLRQVKRVRGFCWVGVGLVFQFRCACGCGCACGLAFEKDETRRGKKRRETTQEKRRGEERILREKR